jgi:hypothetical protein
MIWATHYKKTEFISPDFNEKTFVDKEEQKKKHEDGKTVVILEYKYTKAISLVPASKRYNKKYTIIKGDTTAKFGAEYLKEFKKKYNDADQILEYLKTRFPGQKEIVLSDNRYQKISEITKFVGLMGIIGLFITAAAILPSRYFGSNVVKTQNVGDMKVGDFVEFTGEVYDAYQVYEGARHEDSGNYYFLVNPSGGQATSLVVGLAGDSDLSKKIFKEIDKYAGQQYIFKGEVKNIFDIEKVDVGEQPLGYLMKVADSAKLFSPSIFVDGKVIMVTFINTYLPFVIVVGIMLLAFILNRILKSMSKKRISLDLGL